MRKVSSTNVRNQRFLYYECQLNYALGIVLGRYKAQILMDIAKGYNRFSVLKERIPVISDQMLGRQLRALEKDGMISKNIVDEIPKRIDYYLTPSAVKLCLLLRKMCDWAKEFYFDCGAEDLLLPMNNELDLACKRLDIRAVYHTESGQHDPAYWQKAFQHHLDYFKLAQLSGPAANPNK